MTPLSLILQHTTHPSSHTRPTESAVLDALGIDVDEGTSVSYGDAAVLALTLWAVASDLADRLAVRALVSEIPPQSLREVLDEVRAISAERCDDLAAS